MITELGRSISFNSPYTGGLMPENLQQAEGEIRLHPAVGQLSSLLNSYRFEENYMKAQITAEGEIDDLDSFVTEKKITLWKLRDDVEDHQNNPELIDALDVWGQCRDARGLVGKKEAMVNSGVLHVFAYKSLENPEKAQRFGIIDGIQIFIDYSRSLKELMENQENADLYARVPDKKGNTRFYFLKYNTITERNELLVAFKRPEDTSPRIVTVIPTKEDIEGAKNHFFRMVYKEIFPSNARRSNKLKGASPMFTMGGQKNNPDDFLRVMDRKARLPKKGMIYSGLNPA